MSKKKPQPTPYRDGAKAYRGTGIGQAIPVHPTVNNQPAKALIGFEAPGEGDSPRDREKLWRTVADMLDDAKSEVKARTRDQKTGRWNLGVHPARTVAALDVDEADEFRRELARRGLGLPPATIYSTARGADSPRRQLVYRVPGDWVSLGKMPGGEIIDHAHRFIRAWPSVHVKTGNTYEWYSPTNGDALGAGERMDAPPSLDDLAELPAEFVQLLRADEAARPRKKDRVDVDEWIDARSSGTPSADLTALADAVPTEGIDNNDVIRYLGPIVRAAWDSPGGGLAVRAGIDRYSSGYGRDAERAAYRAVANAIIDESAAREARTMRVTFDLAPAPRAAAKRKKAKKTKKGKKLRHDEYHPSGSVGVTEPPAKPLDVAVDLLANEVLPPLLYWRGTWHLYAVDHWRTATPEEIENLLYAALEHATWTEYTAKGPTSRDWSPSSSRVREVMRALQSKCTLARDAEAPVWLDGSDRSSAFVPARDCLIDPTTGDVLPRSCRFFALGFIDAEVAATYAKPKRWLRFLEQLWGDDTGSIDLLQEWFGYIVSGDARRHKGMLMIGPKRAGKGILLHMAEALVGGVQVGAFGATMSSFSSEFGLELAEGRSLLTMGDLRGSGREAATAAQKMLEIIGGDSVYINRKGRQAITTPLRTRVMIASNSMPKLYDDAGVVESRFVILRLTRSFAGHEDIDLLDKLLPELGGIVQWALEGYRRLEAQGRFTTPASDREDRLELRQNSAPVTEFLTDACTETDDTDAETPRREVWAAYLAWCLETGSAQMEQQQFGPALAGAGHPAHRPRTSDGERGAWRYRGLKLRVAETAEERAKRFWNANGEAGIVATHE